MKNIISAFQKPRIWPFSRLAFSDEDFELLFVTDVPNHTAGPSDKGLEHQNYQMKIKKILVLTQLLSPEDVRPYPKAAPRCLERPRKKVKSRILTESPVKNKIEDETVDDNPRRKKVPVS